MAVRIKDVLRAFFEPNQNQHVRMRDLIDFVDSNNVMQVQIVAGGPIVSSSLDDAMLAIPGATILQLPALAESGLKTMAVFNAAGVSISILPNAADTIDGLVSDDLIDENFVLYFPDVINNNWITLINTGKISLGYALGYFEDNVTATTIVAVGVYEVVGGTFIGDGSPLYTVNAQDITYTGPSPRVLMFDINLSGVKDNTGAITNAGSVSLFKNGIRVPPKTSQEFSKFSDTEFSVSGIVSVVKDDVFDVRVSNDDAIENIIARDMQLRLVEIANS